MHNACWKTKATNTHSEYIILTAFPQQQWLYESASILHGTYIACLVIFSLLKKNEIFTKTFTTPDKTLQLYVFLQITFISNF